MTLRKRRRVREVPVDEAPDLPDRPISQAAPDSTNSSEFDDAFARLSVDQRSILVLHHLHGYGVREIGAWLGIPSGTVKWRLNRARNALRAELES
jgi:RNA polymerase sigma-70 factor (ECF subfamily)